MQKNGGINPQTLQNNPSLMNGFGGLGGLNMFPNNQSNGLGTGTGPTNQNSMGGMMGNPFFSMMGPGLGANQGMNGTGGFPSLFSSPLFSNVNNPQGNQPQTSAQSQPNNFMSMFQNIQNLQQKVQDEQHYAAQIKELNSMGFIDKDKCVKFLK